MGVSTSWDELSCYLLEGALGASSGDTRHLSCLPVTPGGDCSLIKAVAKMREFFGAAPKLRSGRKTQHRDEG